MLKTYTSTGTKYGVLEFVFEGPKEGNPFAEQWLKGTFQSRSETKETEGFYDGDGIYRIRFMPSFEEEYLCSICTSWGECEKVTVQVSAARQGNHGPVRVANTFHFAYDDGTVFYPVGTTCYVWTLQPEEIRQQTWESFRTGPFNKVRFCVFPKHYIYNLKEPGLYPFVRREDSPWKPEDYNKEYFDHAPRNMFGGIVASMEEPEKVWDFGRFEPSYFASLEADIQKLGEMGIEADLILFHPYDRWGFSRMGVEHENFYLRYVVNRFAAFHNVWWSMANEFDLFLWKNQKDWESNAAVVCRQDPYRHLRSIHNCMTMYDHTRAWITHCSIQRIDLYRTAENTDIWRTQYGKPCVLDEIAYEGDLPFGWGNISGQEMTRRFWEAYTRGGYGQHGETYETENEVIWWSHGGTLHGESPARIAFLRKIMEENGGYMEPRPCMFDETCASNARPGSDGETIMYYYGANRPCRRDFHYPDGCFDVDVIDTWDMTVTKMGRHEGDFTIPLPKKPYMAVRLTRVAS